jgi:hypothetical protein
MNEYVIDGHVARMREMRNTSSILVGKPEGKRLLGRPRRRWKHIRMDICEIGLEVWTGCIWLRRGSNVNTVVSLWVP